ncbi:putative membrane protein [Bacillus pseudomycoides]|nr:putative membrane protein [Bacillus pseudomycoides]
MKALFIIILTLLSVISWDAFFKEKDDTLKMDD